MFGGLGRLKQFAEQAVVLAQETVQHAENAIDRVADSVPLTTAATTTTTAATETTSAIPNPSTPTSSPSFAASLTPPATPPTDVSTHSSDPSLSSNSLLEPLPNGHIEFQVPELAAISSTATTIATAPPKGVLHETEQDNVRQAGPEEQALPIQQQQDDDSSNTPLVIKTSSPTIDNNELKDALLKAEKAEAVARKLQRVVKIRELQLEKQALESSELQVSNTNLGRTVEKLTADVATLEKEKKQQMSQIEQLQQQARDVLQERNQLRRVKDQTEGSLGLLVAKDEQIAAVLKEGEILSKKQGLQVESIRRLRKDLADREKEKEELKSSLALSQTRVESLEEQLKQAQANDAKRADTIIAQAAQLDQLNLSLAEMQGTLKVAEGAMTDHRAMAENQVVRTTEKDKLIEKLNDEVRTLEQERDEFARRLKEVRDSASGTHVREDALLHNVTELQAMMSVKSSEYHGQIVGLKDQVRQLQDKYRAAETRCEELMSAIPEATRPLLRQIQSLQSSMDERASVWGEVESSWRKRLRESELALASAKAEKESLVEANQAHEMVVAERDTKLSLMREKFTAVESKLELSQKKAQELEAQVQSLLKQVGQLEADLEEVSREAHATGTKAKKHEETISSLQMEVQAERLAKDQMQRRLAQHESVPIVPSPLPIPTPSHSMDTLSTLLGGDSMSSVETLRSLVRQKDGELSCLRSQLRVLDASMMQIQEQLVIGENKARGLEAELQKSGGAAKKLKALSLRHAAALQLIGEKDEQLQDLQADLDHVKAIFQQQIQELQKT